MALSVKCKICASSFAMVNDASPFGSMVASCNFLLKFICCVISTSSWLLFLVVLRARISSPPATVDVVLGSSISLCVDVAELLRFTRSRICHIKSNGAINDSSSAVTTTTETAYDSFIIIPSITSHFVLFCFDQSSSRCRYRKRGHGDVAYLLLTVGHGTNYKPSYLAIHSIAYNASPMKTLWV